MQTKKSTAGVLKRCLSGFLAVAAVASSGIFLNPLKAEAASPNVLSNSERGVIYANSRTDFRDESIYFMIVTRFYNGDESNDVQCWDGTQYNLGVVTLRVLLRNSTTSRHSVLLQSGLHLL